MENRNSTFVPFLIGLAVGVAAGILLAPSSGEESRQQLMDTADRLREDLKKQSDKGLSALTDAKNSVQQLIDEVKGKVASASEY